VVLLAGQRPQEELALWYNAADVFALLSRSEGCPNVLMEALACGVPAVATSVGGVPEILEDGRLGILLPERSSPAAADGLSRALSADWDRLRIRQAVEHRDWRAVAAQVANAFEQVLSECPAIIGRALSG
ncbi:MAG TPA: glycosyltransferase, partial [Planctomycetaceae bacterium]|nr:glycosyltransferase [Planctomycetaceae bacterium]